MRKGTEKVKKERVCDKKKMALLMNISPILYAIKYSVVKDGKKLFVKDC